MDVNARLPGCAGQAADAVSAMPKSRWRVHQHCWRFPSQNVQIFGNVYNGMSGPNHGPTLKNRLFLLSESFMVTILLDYLGKDNLKKASFGLGWEQEPNWECLFAHRPQRLFLSVYVDDIKSVGRMQNLSPMWKILMKLVDLGEPPAFPLASHDTQQKRRTKTTRQPSDEFRECRGFRLCEGEKCGIALCVQDHRHSHACGKGTQNLVSVQFCERLTCSSPHVVDPVWLCKMQDKSE